MGPRLYDDLAGWWPLLSPPSEYEAEAADLLPRLGLAAEPGSRTLLELGAGGGSLAFHLKSHYRLTLTDRSPGMLAVNQAVNPQCEHLLGDMRWLRLGRQFDIVLVHDAITYATDPSEVQATLQTAAIHCRPGGTVAILPDHIRETFVPETDHGGHDAPDGRGLRYLEWVWGSRSNGYHVCRRLLTPLARQRWDRHRGPRPSRGGPLRPRRVAPVAWGGRFRGSRLSRSVWT